MFGREIKLPIDMMYGVVNEINVPNCPIEYVQRILAWGVWAPQVSVQPQGSCVCGYLSMGSWIPILILILIVLL